MSNLEFQFAHAASWKPKEEVVWSGRPSFWNWWKDIILAVLATLGGLALIWVGRASFAPAGGILAAYFFSRAMLQRASRLYTVTNQRAITRTGLFAHRVVEVELRDIRNIDLKQSFFQRLVGIGDLEISSAANSGVEVLFDGVARPEPIKEAIREVRLATEP